MSWPIAQYTSERAAWRWSSPRGEFNQPSPSVRHAHVDEDVLDDAKTTREPPLASAIDDAIRDLTVYDISRSTVQHNREFYRLIRGGVLVKYRDAQGSLKSTRARVIDFDNAPGSNRFLAVRELRLTGIRTPNYNRRADLVCFVNGLPLVFIELKGVYRNIREGFDNNLSDYMDENVIAHAFHHNAFLIVSNGDHARYGSITSEWEHFTEWKRLDEADKGSLEAEVLLNGMLAHERLLDIVENFILFDESKPGASGDGQRDRRHRRAVRHAKPGTHALQRRAHRQPRRPCASGRERPWRVSSEESLNAWALPFGHHVGLERNAKRAGPQDAEPVDLLGVPTSMLGSKSG